jgi:hypothetical protein
MQTFPVCASGTRTPAAAVFLSSSCTRTLEAAAAGIPDLRVHRSGLSVYRIRPSRLGPVGDIGRCAAGNRGRRSSRSHERELFYIPGPGEFAAIPVTTTPTFPFGTPRLIKQVLLNYPPGAPRQYDVVADGRLLGQLPAEQAPSGTASATAPLVPCRFELV